MTPPSIISLPSVFVVGRGILYIIMCAEKYRRTYAYNTYSTYIHVTVAVVVASARSCFFSWGRVYTRLDPAEGLEFEIPGRLDPAEGLEFGGAKRRRKILGFMCTDAWERVHICEA